MSDAAIAAILVVVWLCTLFAAFYAGYVLAMHVAAWLIDDAMKGKK